MPRTSPTIQVIEIGGNRFESPEAPQKSARVMIAFDLAQIIKSMIEQGTYEIKNDQNIPEKPKGK